MPAKTADGDQRPSHAQTQLVHARPEEVWKACVTPSLRERWHAPGDMTARIDTFDPRVDGGYRMTLTYPDSSEEGVGKTTDLEDSFVARFVEMVPPLRIVEAITFITTDPAFAGEMTMTISLDACEDGTEGTIACGDLPSGVSPEDSDLGTRQSLEKLARVVEGGQ